MTAGSLFFEQEKEMKNEMKGQKSGVDSNILDILQSVGQQLTRLRPKYIRGVSGERSCVVVGTGWGDVGKMETLWNKAVQMVA